MKVDDEMPYVAKYVKLKNGKVVDVSDWTDDGDCYHKWFDEDDKRLLFKDEIIKRADNISDLCNGYWWENKNYEEPIFNPNVHIAKERLEKWLESDKALNANALADITVYGSTYTKGVGWTHVSQLVITNEGVKEILL